MVDLMKETVVLLQTPKMPTQAAQIELNIKMIKLRKIARSEQIALRKSADVYKSTIRKVEQRLKEQQLDQSTPLMATLKLMMATKRMEIPVTVERAAMVIRELVQLKISHPQNKI